MQPVERGLYPLVVVFDDTTSFLNRLLGSAHASEQPYVNEPARESTDVANPDKRLAASTPLGGTCLRIE